MKAKIIDQLRAAGFDACEHPRYGAVVGGVQVDGVVKGWPISFTRRRYGQCDIYTWAHYYDRQRGEWIGLGDPWKKVRPSAAELSQAISDMEVYRAASGEAVPS